MEKDKPSSPDISKKSKTDHALSGLKALLSTAPFTGGLASLMNDYIPDSIEKRARELLMQLNEDFKSLEERYNEEVLTKDYFITTFLTAFKQAVETHQEEKINAFRAIILNTLLISEPNEDEIAFFINITQRLTPIHIKLLRIFSNPQSSLDNNPEAKSKLQNISMGGLSSLTLALLPGYDDNLIENAFKDLYNMGFHTTSSYRTTMTGHGITQKRTSEFGDRYLQFITLPIEIQ